MQTHATDVVVVGSGFGAAAPALRLAEAGLDVTILEKGQRLDTATYRQTQDPRYFMRYLRRIDGDGLTVRYAESLGGASPFYEMVSLRAPWQAFGLSDEAGRPLWPSGLDRAALDPYYDLAESVLDVHQIPADQVPRNGLILSRMLRDLGYTCERARYAERGCLGSGYCLAGCIYGAKRSLLLTYLPRAEAAGATVHTGVEVEAIARLPGTGGYAVTCRDEGGDEAGATRSGACTSRRPTRWAPAAWRTTPPGGWSTAMARCSARRGCSSPTGRPCRRRSPSTRVSPSWRTPSGSPPRWCGATPDPVVESHARRRERVRCLGARGASGEMSEVSNRALALWFLWMDRQGIPHERLVEGTRFRLEDLRWAQGRTSWEDFAELSVRFEALVGGPEALRGVGHIFFDAPALAPFRRIAGWVFHPRQLYWIGSRSIGQGLFTPIESSIEEPTPGLLVIRLRIRPPHRHVPSFFEITAGNFEQYPTLVGWPRAAVSMEMTPGEATYRVQLPARPRRSVLFGLGRSLRALWSPNALFDEIAALHDELRASLEQQRMAREQLAASEARWRAVADATGETIAVLDAEGRMQYVNQRSLGASLVGRPVTDLVPLDERPSLEEAVRAALAGQRRSLVTRSIGLTRPPGFFAATFGPIVIDDRVVGVAVTARDVTAERAAEAERLELERRVLHAERFESLGLLAGGIAHDFNNLLAVVRGNAEIAGLHLPDASPARRALERVDAATARAAELTGQLLVYAGRGTTARSPVDLSARVEEMGSLLQSVLPKSLRFERRLGRGLPLVEADPSQLQQVVMNLIANAAEAVGERPGTVSIETAVLEVGGAATLANALGPSPGPGTYVTLEVADTGPGVDRASLERIFEPFFTTKPHGHGLGLAAVAGIVRGHGGAIEVRSAPGGGAVFRICLPAMHGAPAREEPRPVAPTEAGPAGRGRLVLVVDDEPLVCATAKEILEQGGYRVLTAAEGDEALVLWEAHRHEIVATVLDVAMPGRSGVEVCRALRARDPAAPVVLMSAHAPVLGDDQRSAPDVVLAKPWEPGDLVAAVATAMAARPRVENVVTAG